MAGRVEGTHGTGFGGTDLHMIISSTFCPRALTLYSALLYRMYFLIMLQLRAMKKQEEHDRDVAWLKSLQEREATLDELDKKTLETAR